MFKHTTTALRSLGTTASASVGEYVRPDDWVDMPATQTNTVDILVQVTDSDSNFCAINVTASGGYTVDWGDGNIETFASASNAEHNYDFDSISLNGTETSEGYRQAILRFYPTDGVSDITAMNTVVKHSRSGLPTYSQPWLEEQINCPNLSSWVNYGSVLCRLCLNVDIITIGDILNAIDWFREYRSLKNITYPAGSLANVTDATRWHYANYALTSITYPAGSLANVTNATRWHYANFALTNITYPAGSLANVTDATRWHYANYALPGITYPAGSLANVTNATSWHHTNFALTNITYPAGSLANVTDATNWHNANTALKSITYPAGSLANVTNATSWHHTNFALTSITYPAGSLANVTNATNWHFANTSLKRIENIKSSVSLNLTSLMLARAELVEIFNSLPTVTSQVLTITGNHGVQDLTASDLLIVTNKGWTVVQ